MMSEKHLSYSSHYYLRYGTFKYAISLMDGNAFHSDFSLLSGFPMQTFQFPQQSKGLAWAPAVEREGGFMIS